MANPIFLPTKPGDGIGIKDALTGEYVDGTEMDNFAEPREYSRMTPAARAPGLDPKEVRLSDAVHSLKSRTRGNGSTELRNAEYV